MPTPPDTLVVMRAAATETPDNFVRNTLFSMPPFAFRTNPAEHDVFRDELAERLGVASMDTRLVGSGRLGFSLNPANLLRLFHPQSDLDIVVISSPVFDDAWQDLVEQATTVALADEDERRRLRKTRENLFAGYMRPDHLPLTSKLSKEWFPKLATRFRASVARRHEVRAWLFKSEFHASKFYESHIAKVQSDIVRMLQLRGELTNEG
jgi:hypothetical protein